MKVTLIGGDARMSALSRLFFLSGACAGQVAASAEEGGDPLSAVREADAVILPLPVSRDGIHPTAPEGVTPPTLSEIFAAARQDCLFLGGKLTPAVRATAAAADAEIRDYYTGEELVRRNAVATAEAAVAMAALDLPVTLAGNHFAILGAGRIATHVLTLLRAAGARVSLFARSPAARERAAAMGALVYPIEEGRAPAIPSDVRAVFSTVPACLFPRGSQAPARGTYFYDLGGGAIDAQLAHEAGIILPPSAGLPGKYSPESAALYLFDEIRKILTAEGLDT